MSIKVWAVVAIAASFTIPSSVLGGTLVLGNGLAADCSHEAVKGRADKQVLDICTRALETALMPRIDTAKTFVNRGVVYLRRGAYEMAEKDFVSAERLADDLPEVYINRGAVRIRQARFEEALAELEKGIALGPSEPEKGYYNRAVAREAMEDLQGAYLDFQRASQLKPEWDEPKKQMARFVVERR